jgi:hypothetical protein
MSDHNPLEPVTGTRPDYDAAHARDREDRPAERKEPEGPEPTHDLLLASGETVEHFGAIPTHVAVGDRSFRVLSVTER